ncbi:hypothetical protein [Paucibacter sp. XJ19-41]|uniref:hypothetical protein n=1 Tax=Paucibacter sp. XJ19-41 TaxID=2927824 RepID=UPI002349935C|nr:hypothetical protein [Paucibacter sp. XJ19-41]MDC6166477.1 hypothetical protein [Paucibacter sp. XJ19-41]
MTAQLNGREALFVESLGEMATVVNRVEALVPLLQDTRKSLIDANTQLCNQRREFDVHMHAITEHAKLVAMNHVAQHTREMTRKSVQTQVVEIHEAARKAMGAEIRPTLQELIAPLHRLAYQASQRESARERWERWLAHAMTAAVASSVTLILVSAWLWTR